VLADDDNVALVFGMVETGRREIRARRAVVDPQRPRDLAALDLNGITADELTIVANAREARALAPAAASLGAAAGQILADTGAAAVVVKDSARLPGPDRWSSQGHRGRPVPYQDGVAAGQRRCLRRRIRQRVGKRRRPRRSGARRQR
jgi:hypothetical protein